MGGETQTSMCEMQSVVLDVSMQTSWYSKWKAGTENRHKLFDSLKQLGSKCFEKRFSFKIFFLNVVLYGMFPIFALMTATLKQVGQNLICYPL